MTFWTRDPQITGAAEFDRTLPVTVIGIDCLVTPSGKLDQLCGLPDTGSCPGSAFPAITELAHDTPSWGEITRLIHSTPLPCGKSHETVKRADLAGHAGYGYGYGYCAFHSRYFWGFRLYLSCTPERMPVVWGLANPKIGEREAADEGFAGKEEKPRLGKLGGPTIPGAYSRVAGRALALALGIWHDWLIEAPNKRSLIACRRPSRLRCQRTHSVTRARSA